MIALSNIKNIFNRCGLASLSDLETQEWRDIFTFLELEQAAFLECEGQFRSPEYKWPRDPLHTWSRIWEYPYVYNHLKTYRENSSDNLPSVVDLGSGVTFFPFSVARLGFRVICADIDPICERDLVKASKCVPREPGMVEFRLINSPALPFSDGEVELVYCISVLEHIEDFESTISEMARILKPGGLLLFTIDLDLQGNSEIGVEKYRKLIQTLDQYFTACYPHSTVHPADLLDSASGPYGHKGLQGLGLRWFIFKQKILKPFLGRKPAPVLPFHLAVQGFTMARM
jgi:2-polyprenyl-3-methyl-5-hydroxy-6-metoxy-1,4-benzoquinol methylase